MKISNRKLYLYYKFHPDPLLRLEARAGRVFAGSIETLMGEGKSFEQAIHDAYTLKMLDDLLEVDLAIEFLFRCWRYAPELHRALWNLQNRRGRERNYPIEIEMI